jgi:hypothetical protein
MRALVPGSSHGYAVPGDGEDQRSGMREQPYLLSKFFSCLYAVKQYYCGNLPINGLKA